MAPPLIFALLDTLMKKILVVIAFVFAAQYVWSEFGTHEQFAHFETGGDTILAQAFENRQSNLQVEGEGTVIKVLSDDNDGRRHQRFILKLSSGQTLLVAHNIDLAPRIASLETGDSVGFFGEYEWNSKGGVIHWTHHNPQGSHVSGWLRHQGRVYK